MQIKVRAWDRYRKVMSDPFGLFGAQLTCKGKPIGLQLGEDLEIMLSTGLVDKNGREIFEGDLVRIDWKDARYEPKVAVVKWDAATASFDFGAGTAGEVSWSHEVVGNVWEHEYLLDKESDGSAAALPA